MFEDPCPGTLAAVAVADGEPTVAPSLVKPSAAASPRPEVAPVINTTWPSIRGSGFQPQLRIR